MPVACPAPVQVGYSEAALTSTYRDERNEQPFGRGDKLGKRRRTMPFLPALGWTASGRDRRDVHELNERPALRRVFQRAPIGVVAQIAAGIPR